MNQIGLRLKQILQESGRQAKGGGSDYWKRGGFDRLPMFLIQQPLVIPHTDGLDIDSKRLKMLGQSQIYREYPRSTPAERCTNMCDFHGYSSV